MYPTDSLCQHLCSTAQIPLRRLPRNFPGKFREVGIMEFGLKGTSRVCRGRHGGSRHSGIWAYPDIPSRIRSVNVGRLSLSRVEVKWRRITGTGDITSQTNGSPSNRQYTHTPRWSLRTVLPNPLVMVTT